VRRGGVTLKTLNQKENGMKCLAMAIVVMTMALMGLVTAQDDPGYATYAYQADTGCPTRITVRTVDVRGPIEYDLTFDTMSVARGVLAAWEGVDMEIPPSSQGYILIITRAATDKDAFTIETRLICDEPAPIDDSYSALAAALFARLNWTPDTIAWLNDLYKDDSAGRRAYVEMYTESYATLDALMSAPAPTRTPTQSPVAITDEPTAIPIGTAEAE
jgi:hypothetical protein